MLNTDEIRVAELPSLPLAERANLPNSPAVYFVLGGDGSILYIGRATSLASRWKSHHRKYQLEGLGDVRIAWLLVIAGDLVSLEDALIEHFQPVLNNSGVEAGANGTVSCHIRLPLPLYQWLAEKAREYRSIQEKIIEIVRAARKADEYQQEQIA